MAYRITGDQKRRIKKRREREMTRVSSARNRSTYLVWKTNQKANIIIEEKPRKRRFMFGLNSFQTSFQITNYLCQQTYINYDLMCHSILFSDFFSCVYKTIFVIQSFSFDVLFIWHALLIVHCLLVERINKIVPIGGEKIMWHESK